MKASTANSNRLARQSSAVDNIRKDAKFNQQCNQEALRTKLNLSEGFRFVVLARQFRSSRIKERKKYIIVDKVVV